MLELGAIVAGGPEAYRERPLVTHHCCAAVSPLTLDINSTEAIIYLTERNQPCYATVAPNAGMTAPMTLLGTLTLDIIAQAGHGGSYLELEHTFEKVSDTA